MERDLVSKPRHSDQVDFSWFFIHHLLLLLLLRDLDAEGVKVTAYVTAHLNVEGDVYAEAATVSISSSFFWPQITLFSHPGRPLAEI